jgi:hypothetical protein
VRLGRETPRVRLLAVSFLFVAACGGGAEDTTTTSTSLPPTAEEEAYLDALAELGPAPVQRDVAIAFGRETCRTLRLLQAAGVQGPGAADAIRAVDLDGASSQELVEYGRVLTAAPLTLCTDVAFYAADVSYWLGL